MSNDKHLTKTRFDSFTLSDDILAGLQDAGFEFCTPIQAESLPPALANQDVAGQAQTGTGKTAAFLVATLQNLQTHPPGEKRKPNQPRAFMIAPTRELAVQIHKDELFRLRMQENQLMRQHFTLKHLLIQLQHIPKKHQLLTVF